MTRSLLCNGLMLIALVHISAQAQGPAPPVPALAPAIGSKPALVAESTFLELGTLLEGKEAVARFNLKNTSNSEVKILRAAPS